MKWPKLKYEEDKPQIPKTWLLVHYYEALTILFRIENSLRVLVFSVAKNAFSGKWNELEVVSDDGSKTSIAALAKKRIAQTTNYGYLGAPISCPLMYLTSGEIIRIITHDSYWTHFKPHFRATKQIIRNKLEEIGAVRNSLAHFRCVTPEDVEVLRLNSTHIFSEIEKYLRNMLGIGKEIPTNRQEDWVVALRKLDSERVRLSLLESSDQAWAVVRLGFPCQFVSQYSAGGYYFGDALTVKTPKILDIFAALREYCTFIGETISHNVWDLGKAPEATKFMNICFHRKTLLTQLEGIQENIGALVEKLNSESELVISDPKAEGDIVSSCKLMFKKGDKFWEPRKDDLAMKASESDPPEYWGDLPKLLGSSDFTPNTSRFPWIPMDISKATSF